MNATSIPRYTARSNILHTDLRRFRVEADRVGRSDTIHALRNAVLTAQGALRLVDTRLADGQEREVELLLDLAETRLREGRALIARTRRPFSTFPRSAPYASARRAA